LYSYLDIHTGIILFELCVIQACIYVRETNTLGEIMGNFPLKCVFLSKWERFVVKNVYFYVFELGSEDKM